MLSLLLVAQIMEHASHDLQDTNHARDDIDNRLDAHLTRHALTAEFSDFLELFERCLILVLFDFRNLSWD